MSSSGTAQMIARNSSGACVIIAPISNPPFDPPHAASLLGFVTLLSHRYFPAAMKSSKQFCFFSSRPE